ncbi:MAG: glycosyltransferase [Fibrobacteria bacterium]|nr:glycosyltransferase [Fibrobacteria bacterium]
MKKPTILIYILNLSGGGAERQMINLAQSLSKHVNVILYFKNKHGKYNFNINPEIKTIYFEHTHTINSSPFSLIKQIFHLRKTLRNEHVDIIYARLFTTFFRIFLAKKISNDSSKFVACEASNPDLHIKQGSLKSNWFGLKKYLYKASLRSADAVICLNNFCKNEVAQFSGQALEKIHSIPIGLDTDFIDENINGLDAQTQEIIKGVYNIVSIGRLHQVKDHANLIKAVNILVNQLSITNVNVLILGEGPLYGRLHQLIIDNNLEKYVHLCGFKGNPYIYLAKADFFIFTSLFEGFGNVLLEALYCKTPIITTDCQGGPQELKQTIGDFGEIVPVNDSQKLAESILYTIKIYDQKKETINKLSILTKEIYGIDNVSRQTLELFMKLIEDLHS